MVKNFLFHRVHPDRDILWDPMDVALFDKCIQYISKNFEVVLLEDLVLHIKGNNPDKKYATIVFDDGYKDNIDYALPILEKYNVKASFYIVTDCIEKNIPTWTHILDYSFAATQKNKIGFSFNFLPEYLSSPHFNNRGERVNYVRLLKPALKKVNHFDRLKVLKTVQETFNDIEVPKIMMSWDDLRLLKSRGHYIGSHTITHCMLGTMTDECEIKRELKGSAKKIEEQLGYFPITISYPVGSYNETTKRLSAEAGYKIGLAVNQQSYHPQKHTLFEVPRIELYNESWFKTKLRINGVIGTLSKLFNR